MNNKRTFKETFALDEKHVNSQCQIQEKQTVKIIVPYFGFFSSRKRGGPLPRSINSCKSSHFSKKNVLCQILVCSCCDRIGRRRPNADGSSGESTNVSSSFRNTFPIFGEKDTNNLRKLSSAAINAFQIHAPSISDLC